MLTFNKKYFILAVLLFVIEVLIATFFKTGFIRHYLGDFLVVILIYCFVKSFIKIPALPAAIGVLLFAFFIEMLQYFKFVKWIGLGDNRFANVLLENYFEWADMVAYTLGIVIILGIEWLKKEFKSQFIIFKIIYLNTCYFRKLTHKLFSYKSVF